MIESVRCFWDEMAGSIGYSFRHGRKEVANQVPWFEDSPNESIRLLLQMFLADVDKARGELPT